MASATRIDLPALIALILGLVSTPSALAQEIPLGLGARNWRQRNQAAVALVPVVNQHLASLLALATDPKHPAARPDLQLEPPPSDLFSQLIRELERRPRAKPTLASQLKALLPSPDLAVGSHGISFGELDYPCPELDRQLLVPWGSRSLSIWLLGHVNGEQRQRVAIALTKILDQKCTHLIEIQCLLSLARLGAPGIAQLCQQLNRGSWAASTVFEWMGARGQTPLYHVLQTGTPRGKPQALHKLKLEFVVQQRGHRALLLDLFLHGDASASRPAGGFLRDLSNLDLQPFATALVDGPPEVRWRAAAFLALDRSPHKPELIDLLLRQANESTSPELRIWCLQALGSMPDSFAADRRLGTALPQMLESRADDTVWVAAVLRTMGELGKDVAKSTLDTLRRVVIEHPDRLLQYQAALSLQNLDRLDHLSLHDLKPKLLRQRDSLQDLLLHALCTHGHRAMPLLKTVAQAPEFLARPPRLEAVLEAAAGLDGSATTELRRWLGHRDRRLRLIAVVGLLGEMSAGKHLDHLETALQSSKRQTREQILRLVLRRVPEHPTLLPVVWQQAERGQSAALRYLSKLPALRDRFWNQVLESVVKGNARQSTLLECVQQVRPDRQVVSTRILPLLHHRLQAAKHFALSILASTEPDADNTAALISFLESHIEKPGEDAAQLCRLTWEAIGKVGVADHNTVSSLRKLAPDQPRYLSDPMTWALVRLSMRM